MSYVLLTNYTLGNGTALTAETEVSPDTFTSWEDEWDSLLESGAVVPSDTAEALEELGQLDDYQKDQLLVLQGKITDRELRRRQLKRDGRSDNDIAVILGEDTDEQDRLAKENSGTREAPAGEGPAPEGQRSQAGTAGEHGDRSTSGEA